MPLLAGAPMTARLEFSKNEYRVDEDLEFRVVVDDGGRRPIKFTGTVTVSGQQITVSGVTTVVGAVEYGPFSAPGYNTVQDSGDPSKYIATPTGGA